MTGVHASCVWVVMRCEHRLRRSLSADAEHGFCRAMLCIIAAYAVVRCPSVCLSVTFVYSVETNKIFN